jgi:hypothetical protein
MVISGAPSFANGQQWTDANTGSSGDIFTAVS